ncbi:hypothetical protein BDB00DRAFT_826762 [Zychaea mexicana]|uniref:uncharacterized protein n=1 Tax=Zychaea mexicana TaxID=64656 RepID=UPI0022FE545D|nr:uncharacterized protein BDB00DRAFT_826762 [Zychaea mexicana]KAI9492686.1 hypothetical protein BDB00DRAFT_826762 [Zychaea mexicana]
MHYLHTPRRRGRQPYADNVSYQLTVLFFESYGSRDRKPTKEERRAIINKTGISSRQLTYWLSNHKRRYETQLEEYKRLTQAGLIDSYDAFVEYCSLHNRPLLPQEPEESFDELEQEQQDDDFGSHRDDYKIDKSNSHNKNSDDSSMIDDDSTNAAGEVVVLSFQNH